MKYVVIFSMDGEDDKTVHRGDETVRVDPNETRVRPEPAPPPRPPMPNIPGFELKSPIAEGGMGAVFVAQHLKLEREVAVKVLLGLVHDSETDTGSEELARFEDEAKIIASFNHPNIIEVYDAGDVDGSPYIVMQLASGGTLADRIVPGGMMDTDIQKIAKAMASALQYSHERDIIHRDFKPANVLFDENDTPLLMDFGIAKSLDESGYKTRTGMTIGTPLYMAPEQLMAKPVTHLTDVYSFGLVLYEMITGKRPSQATRVIATPDDIKALRKELGSHGRKYVEILSECLHPEPHKRPSAERCEQMLAALDRSGFNVRRTLQVALAAVVLTVGAGYVAYTQLFAEITTRLTPQAARLFIDGQELLSPVTTLRKGEYDAVVVMRGYNGEVRNLNLDGPKELSISLTRHTMPTEDEFTRVHALLESVETPTVDPGFDFLPYVTLAELKARRLADQPADDITGPLMQLADREDPAAMLTLWLAINPTSTADENLQLINGEEADSRMLLNAAADQFYLPAMFYKALFMLSQEESIIAIDELENIVARAPEFQLAREILIAVRGN